MKKSLILLSLILSQTVINAQYRKMHLDTNHYWQQSTTVFHMGPPYTCNYKLKVIQDSTINGKQFKYMRDTQTDCGGAGIFIESGLVREDTARKVVTIYRNNQEYILYNFNKNVGDTAMMIDINNTNTTYTLMAKDSVLIKDGLYHKRFTFNSIAAIIEGVGSLNGLLSPWVGFEAFTMVQCVARVTPSLSIYSIDGSNCPITTNITNNTAAKKELFIYPNPTNDLINIQSANLVFNSIEIKNILGQTIRNEVTINRQATQINVADLLAGMYFIKVNYALGSVVRPFVKN